VRVNVVGTINVASIALELGTPHVMCISTDKASHPANAYGATKMLDEKLFQEFARIAEAANLRTQYHLVRYGNVLESTGSVVEIWRNQIVRDETIKVTDPEMTRFYLSPQQAVDIVLKGLTLASGMILVPKLKSLSLKKLAHFSTSDFSVKVDWEIIPMRPGEKRHETLLTVEECEFATEDGNYFYLRPSTCPRNTHGESPLPYSSDMAEELTYEEFATMLNE